MSTVPNHAPGVVFVHDWLTGMRGGEKCLEALCEVYPDAPIYTLLYDPGAVSETIRRHSVHTSWMQKIPGVRRIYRYLLPLMPLAVRSWRLPPGTGLVVSLSHCVAKAVDRRGALRHICYCFTPMRYLWDMPEAYFYRGGLGGVKRLLLSPLLNLFRRWDRRTADGVDRFVAISGVVKQRIKRHYGRDSVVIFPPVDTQFYDILPATPACGGEPFYLVVSALVPYKRIDLAVETFNRNGKPLRIVGSGPDLARLKRLARPNVVFEGWQDNETLRIRYNQARALIFPGVEDFGIVPLEASACGTPVIAFREGGVTDTVTEYENGLFFDAQTPEALNDAVGRFEKLSLDKKVVRSYALPFGRNEFKTRIQSFLGDVLAADCGFVEASPTPPDLL